MRGAVCRACFSGTNSTGVNKAVESVRFDIQGRLRFLFVPYLLRGYKPNVVLADELDELNRSGNYFKGGWLFTVYTHFGWTKKLVTWATYTLIIMEAW